MVLTMLHSLYTKHINVKRMLVKQLHGGDALNDLIGFWTGHLQKLKSFYKTIIRTKSQYQK